MADIVVLDSAIHTGLRVRTGLAGGEDKQRFVQVVVREFPLLAVHYPILFSKDSETGAFFCGAMLGFDPGENLFADENGQQAYRPLNLQRGPFFAAGDDLAIDLDNPRVGDSGGEALFTMEGQPSTYLQGMIDLFRELRPGMAMTRVFIDTLLGMKLIEPVDINLSFDDGNSRELQGLYTIDQHVLRELPDDKVVELFRRGYLQLVYLMIASLKQVPILARRKNNRLLEGSEALAGALG